MGMYQQCEHFLKDYSARRMNRREARIRGKPLKDNTRACLHVSHHLDQQGTPERAAQHWREIEEGTICRLFDESGTSQRVGRRKAGQCCYRGSQQTDEGESHGREWTID